VSVHASVRLTAWLVGRPEWGRAMLAEVEQITDARSRRRFTRGCLGALAVSVPGPVGGVLVAGLLSLAVVVAALIRYPGLVTGVGTWLAVGFFCVIILGYIVAAAGLSVRLATTMSTTAVCVSAAAIAGAWMLVGLCASSEPPPAVPMLLLALAPAVALGLGRRATRRATRMVGVQCVGLTALVAGLSLFLLWAGQTVIFAGRPYDAGMLRDFRTSAAPDLATYAISDSLGSGMMLLLLVPLISLAAGAFGAVTATPRRRRTTRHSDLSVE
jgi:hypothetical protein